MMVLSFINEIMDLWEGEKMSREYEFAKMYRNWIEECLVEDEKFEALAFFKLGCEICVRQKELMNITWGQIDYPYVNNIEVSKLPPLTEKVYYPPRNISLSTMNAINRLDEVNIDANTKLFVHNRQWYINEIRESCGDKNFDGHMMRQIGIIFKAQEWE